MASTTPRRVDVKLRGQRKRAIAEQLLQCHRSMTSAESMAKSSSHRAIRIVCIADTHNRRPELPPGDVLIHAGDLTENGSFDEVQGELCWLSSQPHKYKVLIAGNHDVLLDEEFLERYPERRYGQLKTKKDLNWGEVIYLQDSSVALEFAGNGMGRRDVDNEGCRRANPCAPKTAFKIFGSPWTPQYGISAFQYRPNKTDHWDGVLASQDHTPDILVTHGPPRLHLDKRDFHRAGCPYLAQQIHRMRPCLSVFGHIHASYGREDIVLDRVQQVYEEIMTGWAGWDGILLMVVFMTWARLTWFAGYGLQRQDKVTTFVHAAAVGGPRNQLRNSPIVFDVPVE